MNKLNILLKSDRKLFHTQDLAVLWGITNRNTLYTTIKRYCQKGVLIPIFKGLYSTVPLVEISKFALGSALIHRYCYLSCETVLASEGVINQGIEAITFVSSVSLKVKLGDTQYLYRKMQPDILFNSIGIEKKDGYFIATKDRAISDMLYFDPKYYFDNLP